MSDDDLGKKIEAARQAYDARTGRRPPGEPARGEGMRKGYRMASDFFAAIFVGAGIGWLLDKFLGTQPWMLVVWLMFGFAAGVMGIVRIANESQVSPDAGPAEGQDKG